MDSDKKQVMWGFMQTMQTIDYVNLFVYSWAYFEIKTPVICTTPKKPWK